MTKKDVVQISTFRPEKCGIASWTEDVINYSHEVEPDIRNRVFAINGHRELSEYTDFVETSFNKDDLDHYGQIADRINQDENIGALHIQHEFGIFGGNQGDYVKKLLEWVKKPKIVTLHTVPRDAENDYRTMERKKVLKEILPYVDDFVVISDTAKNILVNEYGVNPDKLNVILHGIHDFNESVDVSKKITGLEDRFILSTAGLVRSKRGLEYAIESIAPVAEKHPELLYVIAGQSHPREIDSKGKDAYREKLEGIVKENKLENNVAFINNYLPLNSLLRHINASDACITPYTFEGQISSGVLSYYVGLDKPVISTPFLYAKEILAEGRGIVLPDFNNPSSMSDALIDLLDNRNKIQEIKQNLQPMKERMKWANVAQQYVDVHKKHL